MLEQLTGIYRKYLGSFGSTYKRENKHTFKLLDKQNSLGENGNMTLWLRDAYPAKADGRQYFQQILFQKNGVGLKEAVICLKFNFLKLSGKQF